MTPPVRPEPASPPPGEPKRNAFAVLVAGFNAFGRARAEAHVRRWREER